MTPVQTDQEKLDALYKKLEEYEAKVAFRLSHFRGVAHESASGELASSELKVLQDYVASLKTEIAALEEKMGIKK
jgi:DNA-binding ferritin-like protein